MATVGYILSARAVAAINRGLRNREAPGLPSTRRHHRMSGGKVNGQVYNSYFKLYDASTETHCMIGVADSGWTGGGSPTNCGAVKINGTYVTIEAFISDYIAQDGTYWVWIQSWIDPTEGAKAEIIVGSYNSSTPPGDGHGSLAYANQLLGRATVVDLKITEINQDYLRGGEHTEYLWADCLEEV